MCRSDFYFKANSGEMLRIEKKCVCSLYGSGEGIWQSGQARFMEGVENIWSRGEAAEGKVEDV